MRLSGFVVVTTLVLATVAVPALAAPAPLTLSDALAGAERRSPEIHAAQARMDEARGRRAIASYLLPSNPQINLGFRTDRLFQNQGEGAFDVGLEQELEIFGQRGLRIDVADAELAVLGLELQAVRLTVRSRVTITYFDLMFEELRVAALAQVVDQAARLEEASRRRAAAGDIAPAEHELIAADLATLRADARRSEAERQSAQARLNVLVGRTAADATSTTGEFPSLPAAAPLARLIVQARARRPELRGAEKDVAARGAEVTLRERERLPNPTLSLGYSYDRSVFVGDDFTPAGAVSRLADGDQFLGLQLRLPLPFVRTGRGEVQEARGKRAEAEARRDGLALALDADVTAARARYEAARQRADDLGALEGKLTATLELYEKAYASGKIDLGAFLAVRDRVLRGAALALEARHDAAVAGAELELAVGGSYTEESR